MRKLFPVHGLDLVILPCSTVTKILSGENMCFKCTNIICLILLVAFQTSGCSKKKPEKNEQQVEQQIEQRELPSIVRQNLLSQIPDIKFRVNADLEGKITYLGMDADTDVVTPTRPVKLTHYWKVHEPVEEYKVFVHLTGEKKKLFVNADHVPVSGKYPPGKWNAGDIIRDTHTINLPGDWSDSRVNIYTGLYRDKKRMKVIGPDDGTNRIIAASLPVDFYKPHPVPKKLVAVKTDQALNVDGKLDEDVWKKAPSTGYFSNSSASGRVDGDCEARVAWDGDFLYMAFISNDSDISATLKDRDQDLLGQEAVGAFIDRLGDGRNYVEIQINALGTVSDIHHPDSTESQKQWNSDIKAAVDVQGTIGRQTDEDRGYTVEIALPWKDVEGGAGNKEGLPPDPGDVWRVNFMRYGGSGDVRTGVSAWSQTLDARLNFPSLFGVLEFADNAGRVPPDSGSRFPNVILVSIDTLRRDHLPIYGYPRDTAPNVTGFSKTSVIFDEAIAAHTNTSPSHAVMLTGLFPSSNGVNRNCDKLRNDVVTLAEILELYGFRRGAFVSGWTLADKCCQLKRGFEVYNDRDLPDGHLPAHSTFKRASGWVRHLDDGRPFFLFYHLFDPHFTYSAPDEFARRFLTGEERKYRYPIGYKSVKRMRKEGPRPGEADEFVSRYDGEISYADEHVGRLFDLLKSRGLYENSLIFFVSDHGETLDERQPFFEHGSMVYDEQIRIPFVIRFPSGQFGGRRIKADVHHVDMLPTILDFLGIAPPENVQGVSLMKIVKGEEDPAPREMFSMARAEPGHVKGLEEKVLKEGMVTSIRIPPYKLAAYPTEKGFTYELLNLKEDPLEKNNLQKKHPEIMSSLDEKLKTWRKATGADNIMPAATMSEETKKKLKSLGYIE